MLVKADYQGELRKFRTQSSEFPTYQQLVSNISRIFPQAQSYYLSNVSLTFWGATDPHFIAHEIRSEQEYDNATNLLCALGSYQSSLLRLSIVDISAEQAAQGQGFSASAGAAPETETEAEPLHRPPRFGRGRFARGGDMHMPVPRVNHGPFAHDGHGFGGPRRWGNGFPSMHQQHAHAQAHSHSTFSMYHHHRHRFGRGGGRRSRSTTPAPAGGPSYRVPDSPLYSPTSPTTSLPGQMDVDAPPSPRYTPVTSPVIAATATAAPAAAAAADSAACCNVEEGRREMRGMMSSFLRDFSRVMGDTFGETPDMQDETTAAPRPATVTPPVPSPRPDAQPVHNGVWCDSCGSGIRGIRYKCSKCANYDLCERCFITVRHPNVAASPSRPSTLLHGFLAYDSTEWPRKPMYDGQLQFSGARAPAPASDGSESARSARSARLARFLNVTPMRADAQPNSRRGEIIGRDKPEAPVDQAAAPIVHRNIVCDNCDDEIIGDRHKCVDCADYDLCGTCIETSEEFHPTHRFFTLSEPGNIVVHTIDDLPGIRSPSAPAAAPAAAPVPAPVPAAPAPAAATSPAAAVDAARHNATCDLCDSPIVGARYKCVECPDWDSCMNCFSIVGDQHPRHTFVRVAQRGDYIPVSGRERPARHRATCDECKEVIYGVRFKCFHPGCADFDLCAKCEALPIAVHPANHPLLKLRDPSTPIPAHPRLAMPHRRMPVPVRIPAPVAPSAPVAPVVPLAPPQPIVFPPVLPPMPVVPVDSHPLTLAPIIVPAPPAPVLPSLFAPAPPSPPTMMPVARNISPFIPPPPSPDTFIPQPPSPVTPLFIPPPPPLSPLMIPHPGVPMYEFNGLPTLPNVPLPMEERIIDAPLMPGALPLAPPLPPTPPSALFYPPLNAHASPPAPALPPKPARFQRFDQRWNPGFSRQPDFAPPQPPCMENPFSDAFREQQQDEQRVLDFLGADPNEMQTEQEERERERNLAEIRRMELDMLAAYRTSKADYAKAEELRVKAETEALTKAEEEKVEQLKKEEERAKLRAIRRERSLRAQEAFKLRRANLNAVADARAQQAQAQLRDEFWNPTATQTENGAARRSMSIEEVKGLFTGQPANGDEHTRLPSNEDKKPSEQLATTVEAESTRSWLDMLESSHNQLSLGELVARATERAFPTVPATEPAASALERMAQAIRAEPILRLKTPPVAGPVIITPQMVEPAVIVPAPVLTAPKPATPAPAIPPAPPALLQRLTVAPLRATFISDNNVPDGHVFPPGAEFTKSWLLANEGDEPWPAGTELAFVSGSRLAARDNAPDSYHVGSVAPGARTDVSAADMKAPDAPGRYIGYWRLRDGAGNFFGHRMWCDIVVAEPEHDSDGSLASSSVVMPRSAPSVATASVLSAPAPAATAVEEEDVTVPPTPVTLTASDDGFSDFDTESSGSVIDFDSDNENWVQARTSAPAVNNAGQAAGREYVVLYDSASTSGGEDEA